MKSNDKGILIVLLIVGLAIGVPVGYFMTPTKKVEVEVPGETVTVETPVPALSGTIPIGVLYSTVANIDNEGVAIPIALEEINDYVKSIGLDVEFELIEECAEGQATFALEKLQSMAAKGVQVVVGWNWSTHAKAAKEYADAHHIVLFSGGSSSPVLEIDDYVFRLAVTDSTQAKAFAPAIWETGVRHLIVVQRGEAWGDGNYETIKKEFEALGGEISARIRYDAEKTEFAAEAAILNDEVVRLNDQYGADTVGIAAWSLPEFPALFSACKEYPTIVDALWFGSDGFGRSTILIEEIPDSYKTRFLCMRMGSTVTSRNEAFVTKYVERSGGLLPATYRINMYDIMWITCKAVLESGVYDGATLKKTIPTVAEQYFGAIGWTKLNEYGDRAESNFELWTIELDDEGIPEWALAASFDSASGVLSWIIPIK